ncbi:MAG: threonine--tRNA ligase [Nanoarchaeota archaeon]
MKLLFLHVDYIEWQGLKKALRSMKDLSPKELEKKRIEDALGVLVAVEKGDSEKSTEKLVKEIKDVAKQVNAKNVVLYPYAHLSKNLGSPEVAVKVLEGAEKKLKKDFNVNRAPFGYYKSFELKVKGHPLSELSREIAAEGDESKESYDEKKLLREISKSKLDTSKLKPNDHRIIGQQMDLYSFNESAPGMVFWHNNGLIIRNELINFWREIHRKVGYQEIKTPQILDKKLWQISGHWEKFKENMFLTEYEKRNLAVKPMNCPGGMIVFKSRPKSYRDLPLKVGEMGEVHRIELSGTLGGLFRVIQFTQDDAHIFCNEKQMEEEVGKALDLLNSIYSKFNFEVDHVELSTRPEKRIGNEKQWDKAEEVLEKVLKYKKMKFTINKGDGAFYGPKIDFHVKDSLNRTWQCGTFQLDFAMPERFELEYTDKNNKRKRPVMIHRTIYGSVERFLGILIESTKGRLSTWLAPIQVRVLSFTDRNQKYAEEVIKKLEEKIPNLRIDSDFTQKGVPAKVKDAEIMRVPYVIVVGDREEKENNLAVRIRGNKKIEQFNIDEFVEKLGKEILERN